MSLSAASVGVFRAISIESRGRKGVPRRYINDSGSCSSDSSTKKTCYVKKRINRHKKENYIPEDGRKQIVALSCCSGLVSAYCLPTLQSEGGRVSVAVNAGGELSSAIVAKEVG